MRRAPSVAPELPGYEYVSVLGSGGFSDVFLYQQRLPRRRVAVKVLLTEQLNPSTQAQFVDEANLMAQLSTHPYIVTIYHADVAGDGRPYFVMEHCSGPSLAERYKRQKFGVEDALRTGVRLAGAIATAHSAGILHRDIKPANVLTNDFGWPALTDFGISSSLDEELPVQTSTGNHRPAGSESTGTGESQSVGMSVPWSPPEMFEDDPRPDVRSDVFSLAATIHTLLAGQTPFEIHGRSNGTLDLIGRIERGAITPIGRDDVPRSLVAVLAKAMATRRDDRFATAVDFARALQRVELELGYAPTGIDIPTIAGTEHGKPDAPAGDDETRARSVVSIAAQAPAPARAAPATPAAPPAEPDQADATRVRGARVIEPGSAPSGSALARSADAGTPAPGTPSPAKETTVVRPRGSVRAQEPVSAPAAADDAPIENASGRRRLVMIGSIAAAVLLIGAVVAAVTLTGIDNSALTPSASPVPAKPDSVNSAAGVPAPVLEGTATSEDGSQVTFTVSNPSPLDGDVYRWARAETPNQPKLSAVADITVDGVVPGSTVCVDIYLQRTDGKISEANRACNR
ncbi:serine/threonine protein kinase [Cryobacterium zongtaii]|uniref:non-specific serine/threonine protein kinase n=1 Tax=Cryobacterium zongtaii TaxID=1259217 RepID=A0A2S3ZFZ7_9MICO|nr:serine/threonine-protein kinase [Cryobacterium zongtaii]POH66009.1 serine/threonine protein kinase [Cryobacterium zongtaii]